MALAGATGSGSAFGSVVVAQHVQLWLGMLTMAAGLASALLSMYWMNRLNRVRVEREQNSLCDWCKGGHPPARCPIPEPERSADCPLMQCARRRGATPLAAPLPMEGEGK